MDLKEKKGVGVLKWPGHGSGNGSGSGNGLDNSLVMVQY